MRKYNMFLQYDIGAGQIEAAAKPGVTLQEAQRLALGVTEARVVGLPGIGGEIIFVPASKVQAVVIRPVKTSSVTMIGGTHQPAFPSDEFVT